MEVVDLHLDFLPTEYSKKIWADRYLQSEKDDVFKRVAKAVANKDKRLGMTTEEQEAEFLNLFEKGLFIGGGRHLCNMGGTGNNMPGNCFALPIEDSREGIYKTLFEMAEIESKGGGVGVNFGPLRPKGAEVKGSKGKSSGPCAFIDLYNASISTISQGGCLAKGTKLSTTNGEISIEKLVNSTNFKLLIDGEEFESSAWYSGDKECVTLYFNNERQLTCTLDHPIFTISGILPAEKCLDKVCYTNDGNAVVYFVEQAGILPTYDFEEKVNNFGFANSIKVHNSRRGALIAILDVSHPDIEEFIHAKEDKNRWNNLNISVGIYDEFMEAVYNNDNWNLTFNGEVYKTVKAIDLWNQICESAARSGEPGVLFLDTINKDSQLGDVIINTTNPCCAKGTLVATPNGWVPVEDLNSGDLIVTVMGIKPITNIEKHSDYPIKKVSFSNGLVQYVTENHQYHILQKKYRRFSPIPVRDIKVGDFVRVAPSVCPNNEIELPEGISDYRDFGFMIGVLIGDGCYTEKCMARHAVKLAVNKTETAYIESLRTIFERNNYPFNNALDISNRSNSACLISQGKYGLAEFIRESGLGQVYSYEKRIPLNLINSNKELLLGLLDGIISSDGNINLGSAAPMVRIASTSYGLLSDIRLILLSLGCSCSIYKKNRGKRVLDGREILTKHQCYDLCISGSSLELFKYDCILTHPEKRDKIQQLFLNRNITSNTWLTKISSIEDAGKSDVYDIYESSTDTWITEGVVQRGCGELPLLPYSACNLGSLILPNFFINGKLDKKLLAPAIRLAVLYLDNLLDVSVWPLDKIRETVLDYRILGLGVIGLADLLFLEGISYGDNSECLEYIDNLFYFIYKTAQETSEELAEELGVFPKYDPNTMDYKPRRNAQLMAMAPTGTISALYGASWGIEPYFSQTMIRDERIGKDVVTYQVLDKYMQDHKELPEYARFAVGGSNTLTVDDHLAVLKIIARNIDGAVSKTVSMPRGSTYEDVDNVYRYLHANDIKGGTVYVEGSRELEAVKAVSEEDIDEDEDDIDDCIELVDLIAEPRPRPEVIEGCTYKVKYCFDKPSIYVTINNYEEEPFEIFFSTKDSVIQEWLDMLARTITALFRRGISCDFLVKDFMQYSSSQCGGRFRGKYIQSASAAIGMVLKEHLRSLGIMPKDVDVEGIKKMAKEDSFGLVCPECFERTLVKQGGCSSCLSCGFSKCE